MYFEAVKEALQELVFPSIHWLENFSHCEKLKEYALIVTEYHYLHLNRVRYDNTPNKTINLAKIECDLQIKTHNVKIGMLIHHRPFIEFTLSSN